MRFLLLLLVSAGLQAKTIYVATVDGIDQLIRPGLEESGYQVVTTEDATGLEDVAAIFSFNRIHPELLSNLANYPREKCFLFVLEPPVVEPDLYDRALSRYFGKIFVMFDDMIDHEVYFKLHYPQPSLERVPLVDFSQKKFSCMIASNKNYQHENALYPERKKVIRFFSKRGMGDFDLFGRWWDKVPNWRGAIPDKYEILKGYKFSFCYENMGNQKGYISEKIFDCFIGGCVPIYLGATNITDYVPKECFVDRRAFRTEGELYYFLKKMDRETHESYLEAIGEYLKSPEAQLYSLKHFVELLSLLP